MASSMVNQITSLSELLQPQRNDAENSDDEIDRPSNKPSLNPGNIGTAKQGNLKSQDKASKDIWDVEELTDSGYDVDNHDPRPEPEYDMIFKQAVTSEDMFLQMGNRNPSTASCEDILIKIKLPNTEHKDVDLDVTDVFLSCRTPKYKLGLHLPHKVDSANGKAQWDADKQLLTVSLRLVRELDFLYS